MIRFYYDFRNSSSRKAIEWFKSMNIEISTKKIQDIPRADLLHALYLSERGFTDILKGKGKAGSDVERMKNEVQQMNFSEAVDFILVHTDLLKVPIILDENKLMIGFNSEEIRKFTSRVYRRFEV
ncbi:ArsC/Spx/MgsR family protein [Lactococcus garvieae]|uniref:ArsC/Spx/MgsR family protein n=1 Tax=Lactococcus garvieae TaxID=1363 RepID=UPI0032B7F20A